MTQTDIIEMATKVWGKCDWHESALCHLEAFAKLVASKATEEANARANASWTLMCKKMVEAERDACLSCYSVGDDVTDWVDKILARGEA